MTRERLSNRRPAVTINFEHCYPGAGPRVFTATVGVYPDGRPGEVFLDLVDGTGKNISVDTHDAAVVVSFALQHGANLRDLAAALLRSEDGAPHGFTGAMLDAIAREFPEAPEPEPTPAPEPPDGPAPLAQAEAVAA